MQVTERLKGVIYHCEAKNATRLHTILPCETKAVNNLRQAKYIDRKFVTLHGDIFLNTIFPVIFRLNTSLLYLWP